MAAQTPEHSKARGMPIASLLSPPDLSHNTFDSPSPQPSASISRASQSSPMSSFSSVSYSAGRNLPISPPISPATRTIDELKQGGNNGSEVRDPQLFPEAIVVSRNSYDSIPLFQQPKSPEGPRGPGVENYNMRATSWEQCAENPVLYFRKLYESNSMYVNAVDRARDTKRKALLQQAPPAKRRILSRSNEPLPIRSPRQKRVKKTYRQQEDDYSPMSSPLPRLDSPKKRLVLPKKAPEVNFQELPDFCPPVSTLDNLKPNVNMKPDWKNNKGPLDLADDEHLPLLHPKEAVLPSALQLSCASYLYCKRKIFQAKVDSLRKGTSFLKTHAQQACNIDVNKASKIWTQFDKVGWFDRHHFVQYL